MEHELESWSFEAGTRSYIFKEKKYFQRQSGKKSAYQKHLGMFLASKLDFDEHIKGVFDSKSIGLTRKIRNFLQRSSLLQIYKCFVRPHLDYGEIIYDVKSFQQKLESIQFNAVSAIIETIRGTSREKIYPELGLESLQDRCWYRKLRIFYRILNSMSLKYISDIIPRTISWRHSSRNANILLVIVNSNYFMSTFFPSKITEWNKVDLSSCNSTSLYIFKRRLSQFVKPLENSFFTCHNPIGIKYLTRLRLEFSQLCYRKFKHGFLDAVDLLCSCITRIENTVHYFLNCPNFQLHEIPFSMKTQLLNCAKYLSQWKHNFWTARNTFLNEIAIVDRFIIDQHEIKIIQTFLYDNPTYSVNDDKLILNASMTYILETKRFDGPIF